MFIQSLEDNYLHWHVDFSTRFRANQNLSLLDLLLTDDPDIATSIASCPPLGKSDHICIEAIISPTPAKSKKKHPVFNFSKGDYDKFREVLEEQEWDGEPDDGDLESNWNKVKSNIL